MKRKTFGCYCCNIRKEDLIKPNAERCEDCTALGLEWPCYHQPMSDEELMNKLADEKGTLYQEYRHLRNYPYRTSRIRHGDCAIRDHRSDYRHIAFNCDSANATEKLKFKALLKNELKLRDIQPCSENTAELRIQVFELLLVEDRYAALAEIIEGNDLSNAKVKLEKTVPCLLHLENRLSEAMVFHLLMKAVRQHYGNGTLTNELMVGVERIINEYFFGTPGSPSNWKFPINSDGTMGDIKFANWRARRVVQHIDSIIELAVSADEREKWVEVFRCFRDMLEV